MTPQEIAAKVELLEQQVELAKRDKARLEGRVEELMNRLKTEFNVTTVEEAETLLAKMQQDIADNSKRIENMYSQLNTKYGWEA